MMNARASNPPVFLGVGISQLERRSDRGLLAFALDAAIAAIKDAGLSRDDIDGYVGAPLATNAGALHAEGGDEISARALVQALGIPHLRFSADLFKGFPTDMAISAAHALLSGECRFVLGVRALYNPQGVDYATGDKARAHGEEQFRAPFGYSAGGARFATRAQRYLALSGATRRDLYEIVALSRRNARANPDAIWRTTDVALDDYLAAPMVSDPLCRFDCDLPICGAAAFVMSRKTDAPASAASCVTLAGWAGWQQPEQVFASAGMTRDDIHMCQLYDGFSSMVWEFLERFGWCEEHNAWRFIRDGHCERDGALPINTFGGSLGEGRLHGMGHVREAVLQLSGRAGARQVARAETCLVQVGPYDSSSFLILKAA